MVCSNAHPDVSSKMEASPEASPREKGNSPLKAELSPTMSALPTGTEIYPDLRKLKNQLDTCSLHK
jgi:hypothetical protein